MSDFGAAAPPPVPRTPAGWYPDPATGRQRWWDGTQWTEHHAPVHNAPAYSTPVFNAPANNAPVFNAPAYSTPVYNAPAAYVPGYAAPLVMGNGYATAALILGIAGFLLMAIPFVGFLLGGIPDILAIIFGILGIGRANRLGRIGQGASITGLVLGGVSALSFFIGAGTFW